MDNKPDSAGRLVYANGKGMKTFHLSGQTMLLGSEEGNDVVIKRPRVSRTHARIDYDGQRWTLTDMDSVTGTLVNEAPITRARLANGDRISIGAAMLRFETDDAAKPDHADNGGDNGSGAPTEDAAGAAVTNGSSPQMEQTIEVKNESGNRGAHFTPIEALVAVQPEGGKRPLFLVAAGYSDVWLYSGLAARLGEDQPLYVLQVPVTASVAQPTDSIEFLAAHYIEAMRGVQAEGPYQIAGYNVGGVVAFEVARQLDIVGEVPSTLLLVDTPYPLGNSIPHLSYRNIQAVDRLNQKLMQPLQQAGVTEQMTGLMFKLGAKLDGLRTPQVQRMMTDYFSFMATLSDRGYETNLALTQSYRPAIATGRAVLILAEDSPVRYTNAQWDWSVKFPNGLDSRLIPGGYSTILHEPDVAGLAKQVAASLE